MKEAKSKGVTGWRYLIGAPPTAFICIFTTVFDLWLSELPLSFKLDLTVIFHTTLVVRKVLLKLR